MSALGRFCCKTLFAPVIKNFPGRRRDFRVKMWGASSPDDKLTGDLPNEIETTHIGGFRSDRVIARKLAPGSFGSFATKSAISGREQVQHTNALLDHPVSEREQRRRNFDAKRPGDLEVDDELIRRRLQNGQLRRRLT